MADELLFDDAPQHPGKMIEEMLTERGWTQDELAAITGKSRTMLNQIVSGKFGISADMAIALAAAFGNTSEEWLRWDARYRLSLATNDPLPVQKTAKLYAVAPVREMQRRGWIRQTDTAEALEAELHNFFESSDLQNPEFPVAMRKTAPGVRLTPSERAWCFRARQLASTLIVPKFKPSALKHTIADLRVLAAYPKEAIEVAKVLAACGIRFIVVEPIGSAKIDGAAFWLDEHSPVIAVSIRFDRNDSFWFTLMHECMHIANTDALSVDAELVEDLANPEKQVVLVQNEIERRANDGAADALIPKHELESFIRRVGPLYSKERIIQFAHRMKIHPAIIVGQLQKRKEVGYYANREMFTKIRSTVIQTALTDGWGRFVEGM